MIELLLLRNLRNFLKTEVIRILLLKRKDYVHKVFTQLGYPCNAFVAIINGYHAF